MTVSLETLRDRATEALQAILPDAPAIVIALASELPKSHRGAGVAYCGKNLDTALRPHLGFKGRAACLVVEDAVLLENQTEHAIARNLAEPTPSMLKGTFLEAVCHELAHVVVNNWVPRPDDPEPPAPVVTARVEKLCVGGPDLRSEREQTVPWWNHHGRWVRTYLHVVHRLSQSMRIAIIPQLDTFHAVSPASAYRAALGDEPNRLAVMPLPDIGDISPPPAFIELWQADVKRWWLGLSAPTETQTAMLFAWRDLFTP